MKRTLVLLFFSLSFFLSAQNQVNVQLDSLINLTNKLNGNQLVDILIEIAELQAEDDILALQTADKAIFLAKEQKYSKGLGMAFMAKGSICIINNNPFNGIEHYLEAERIFLELDDKFNRANALMGIAEGYAQQGLFDQANQSYKLVIPLFLAIHDHRSLANAYYKAGTASNMDGHYHLALEYFLEAADNYQLVKDNYGLMLSKNSMGIVYYHLGDYTAALNAWKEYERGMRELKDWDRVIAALSNIGLIYNHWAAYNEALTQFSEALALAEQYGQSSSLNAIYNSMGNSFQYSGNNEKSLEYYFKAIGIATETENRQGISIGMHNIGEVHLKLGHADSALYYVQKSLQIENTLFNKLGIAETKATLGEIYFVLKKHRLAFSFFKQAEEVFLEANSKNGLADVYQKYGQAYADIDNDSLATFYLNKSNNIAKEIDEKKLEYENHHFLSEYFEKRNDFKKALEHQKLFHQINDSVYSKIALDNTAYLTMKLENEETENELIALQHKQDVLNYQNKIKGYIVYFVSLILIILVISFYLRYQANKKATNRLNDQYQVLLESEGKIKALFDASHDILILVNRSGIIDSANAKAEQIFRNGKQLVGYNFDDIVYPFFQEQFKSHIARVINKKLSHGFHLRSDNKKTFDITISPVFRHSIEVSGLAIYMQDITDIIADRDEKKILEERLFQVQKMDSIGTMAGGIAHDFNNYLGTILGYGSMGYEDSVEGSALKRYFNQIIAASKSAQHTVQKILTFSRKNESQEISKLNLVDVAKEAIEMVESTRPKEVVFEQNYISDNIEILGDAIEIQQVFINLFTNAFHALEGAEKGSLKCSISNTFFKESHLKIVKNINSKKIAAISVKDDGMGMPQHVLKRVFEPFFTTKKVGSGTGLGLSVVHGIIENHKGELIVESKMGKGSTFYIYLPAIS